MRILHTADWHVGRLIKGRSRADEHRAVLAEIAGIAAHEKADIVIVAGDLFDVAAPAPEAEEIVYGALLALADGGAHVVLVSGNHDHPRRFEAIKPLLERTGRVHAGAALAKPSDGGVLTLSTRGGETARIALFPFLSQRGIVTAAALMCGDAADHAQSYAERCAELVRALCAPFSSDSVNLVVAHLMVERAVAGGGERAAHLHEDYRVDAACFDHPSLHYVALGHVHRAQRIPAPCPVWYCGSPLQLDFGETENEPGVLLIEARAGKPAEVETHRLQTGRRLRTIHGAVAALGEATKDVGDAFLRLILDDPPHPGLADELQELYPNAIRIELAAADPHGEATGEGADRLDRAPRESFAEYLTERGEVDPRLIALFDQLLDEAHEVDAAEAT
ncbi:MAG TPA: exonuclease SbcCD subunit D [Thermoanaerobaculia bacterium]|nr:exonuclease SbcCD subunit D [Thermoanaerobaculia bacterium]